MKRMQFIRVIRCKKKGNVLKVPDILVACYQRPVIPDKIVPEGIAENRNHHQNQNTYQKYFFVF